MTTVTLFDIASILRTTEKNVATRVVALKIGDTCSRCCGTGRYSYCQTHGDRCFQCGGFGQVMPKNLVALLARAEAAVADGTLAAYLARLAAAREAKNAVDRVMAAWKDAEKLNGYEKIWRELRTEPEKHADIVRRNSICHAAVERVQKAVHALKPHEVAPILKTALAEIAEVHAELSALATAP